MSLRPLRCPRCQTTDVSPYIEKRAHGRRIVWAYCRKCFRTFTPADELRDLKLQLWGKARATDPDYDTVTRHLWDQFDVLEREYAPLLHPMTQVDDLGPD